jgi:tight adherence protein C
MDDATRLAVFCALVGGLGATLLLAQLRWFSRPSLAARLAPFATGGRNGTRVSAAGLASLVMPLGRLVEQLCRVLGVRGHLEAKLALANVGLAAEQFRLQQVTAGICALVGGALVATLVQPPLILVGLVVLAPPLVAVLGFEQWLIAKVDAHKQRVLDELPVVSEQLSILLNAGFSLGVGLQRVADRTNGTAKTHLQQVCARMSQGVGTEVALGEWAAALDIAELNQLTKVLCLGPQTADLGKLVSGETRLLREESQRRLMEQIEKRSQQVWIPVTVATLIPGVIFLIIPFLQALQLFSAT